MNTEHKITLIVEKGAPYLPGDAITLGEGQYLLGRSSGANRPDIAFADMRVSRKHALLVARAQGLVISDLGSKHGTRVNLQVLEPHRPYPLLHGDSIELASGLVSLRLSCPWLADGDRTVDLTGNLITPKAPPNPKLVISLERREVSMEGQRLNIYGKDLDLLLLLYRNRGKAVSYDEIRRDVWPERAPGIKDGVPDVGMEEIAALVYRLRKKLTSCGSRIVTVPRYGYRLEV